MPNKDNTYKDKPIKDLDDWALCYYLISKDLLCDYCPYREDCRGVSTNGIGEPVYPPCNDGGESFYGEVADVFRDEMSEYSKEGDITLNQLEEKGVL